MIFAAEMMVGTLVGIMVQITPFRKEIIRFHRTTLIPTKARNRGTKPADVKLDRIRK